jgi:hypothetical protein
VGAYTDSTSSERNAADYDSYLTIQQLAAATNLCGVFSLVLLQSLLQPAVLTTVPVRFAAAIIHNFVF